ncbi:MAG: hypothetical protein KatS3mg076_0809 [Candidatus Binatia bacterium]|nr:MAG: hypothetical protein KatS3mg076_0809 [Candidatus Binatia bacterium]
MVRVRRRILDQAPEQDKGGRTASIVAASFFCAAVFLAGAWGCRREPPPEKRHPKAGIVSPQARWHVVELLREDLAAKRHPSDGGGRAWIDAERSTPSPVEAGSVGHWLVVYEAGPLGIAEGGRIFFFPSPFWGWSPAQADDPEAPGYTEVRTDAPGLRLEVETSVDPMLSIRVAGRRMEPGERLEIHYGAGPRGARVDRYAESGARLWLAVDGDGDGVRAVVGDSPSVDVAAGPPERVILTGPSVVRPGEKAKLTVAVLDAVGNAGTRVGGEVRFVDVPEGFDLPLRVPLSPEDRGVKSVGFSARREGVFRLEIRGPLERFRARSNPIVVSRAGTKIYWGDLHGHSNLSDGTGTPEEYYRYARDVAALDVAALTDHDHWGTLMLDQHPELWEAIRSAAAKFDEPGRFVALVGFEWTSWIHGHRHVLYFGGEEKILGSLDERYERPEGLWSALRGKPVVTVAHHSAGGPIATNWSIPPDPVLEPVTEIVSVHGVSEAPDVASVIYDPVPGNFVRDALDRGYRLGFVGSGDSHDGHPGLVHLAGPSGGLAAIVTEELTRSSILEALRRRRVYATNGPRAVLRVSLDGRPMGSTVPAQPAAKAGEASGPGAGRLAVSVAAPSAVERIELVRKGRVETLLGEPAGEDVFLERRVEPLRRGEYLYVRVHLEGGGLVWSSPFFAE